MDGLPFNDIGKIRGETRLKEPGPVFCVAKGAKNGVYVEKRFKHKWLKKDLKRVIFCDT